MTEETRSSKFSRKTELEKKSNEIFIGLVSYTGKESLLTRLAYHYKLPFTALFCWSWIAEYRNVDVKMVECSQTVFQGLKFRQK